MTGVPSSDVHHSQEGMEVVFKVGIMWPHPNSFGKDGQLAVVSGASKLSHEYVYQMLDYFFQRCYMVLQTEQKSYNWANCFQLVLSCSLFRCVHDCFSSSTFSEFQSLMLFRTLF